MGNAYSGQMVIGVGMDIDSCLDSVQTHLPCPIVIPLEEAAQKDACSALRRSREFDHISTVWDYTNIQRN